jgi:hypothetical protein
MSTLCTKLTIAASALSTLALLAGCRNGMGWETDFGPESEDPRASLPVDSDGKTDDGYHEEGAVGSVAEPLVAGAIYRIRNLNAQLCLDIPTACNPNDVDGCLATPIILTPCGGNGGPTQQFELVAQGDVTYKFRHVRTGLVIMMAGPCSENGGIAVLYNDTTNALYPNRSFTMSAPDADGYVCIASAYSGLFLNVPGASRKPGAALYQYGTSCSSTSQKWRLEAL